LLARQKRRALVVLVTNVRDKDDEELLNAVRQLSQQHQVLVASLRESTLEDRRHSQVQTIEQALEYCATVDYLNARSVLHEKLSAQGVQVIDAPPSELSTDVISRYLSWKKSGALC